MWNFDKGNKLNGELMHCNKGNIPVAFLFSAPGAREVAVRRPVAGITGENLDIALDHLKKIRPEIFCSSHRYDYRITNAFTRPLAIGLGDNRTEALASEILDPNNLSRILLELDGCKTVLLCGRKAQLLEPHLQLVGRVIVKAWHIGNIALSTKYRLAKPTRMITAGDRRKERCKRWASDVLQQLESGASAESPCNVCPLMNVGEQR